MCSRSRFAVEVRSCFAVDWANAANTVLLALLAGRGGELTLTFRDFPAMRFTQDSSTTQKSMSTLLLLFWQNSQR